MESDHNSSDSESAQGPLDISLIDLEFIQSCVEDHKKAHRFRLYLDNKYTQKGMAIPEEFFWLKDIPVPVQETPAADASASAAIPSIADAFIPPRPLFSPNTSSESSDDDSFKSEDVPPPPSAKDASAKALSSTPSRSRSGSDSLN